MLLSTRRYREEPTPRSRQPSLSPTVPAPTSHRHLVSCAWCVAERSQACPCSAKTRASSPPTHNLPHGLTQHTAYHTASPCLRARSRVADSTFFFPLHCRPRYPENTTCREQGRKKVQGPRRRREGEGKIPARIVANLQKGAGESNQCGRRGRREKRARCKATVG